MENIDPRVPTPAPEPNKPENGEGKPENTDYKAELEKLKKQLGQAEHTILKLKAEKDKNDEVDVDDPDEQESVREIARKEAGKIIAGIQKSQAKSFARTLAENEDESELIMFHYENTIMPSGDVEADIRRAKLIANEKRISKEIEQAKKAALSKQLAGQAGGTGQKPPQEEEPPQMDDKSKRILVGFKWDSKRKGWVGPSGRFHAKEEIERSITK